MGSVGIETAPARMMSSEQTVAKTGRRIKKLTIEIVSRSLSLWNYRHAIHQHLYAAGDHALTGLNAVQHHIIVSHHIAHLDHALPGHRFLPFTFRHKSEHLAAHARNRRYRNGGRLAL